jgi:hypothetical protein
MAKTRATDDDGKIRRATEQQSKDEVICPLTFKLTGAAVNYDITWLSTVQLDEDEGPEQAQAHAAVP